MIRHFQSVDIFPASFFVEFILMSLRAFEIDMKYDARKRKNGALIIHVQPSLSPLKAHSTVWAMYYEERKILTTCRLKAHKNK